MELRGENLIGFNTSRKGGKKFFASDPKAGEALPTAFFEATSDEISEACRMAEAAAKGLRSLASEQISELLEQIAENIASLGAQLIDVASQESALSKERITGERARTVGQLRMFATLVREGSWVDARIDPALPNRTPVPRPDLRRMLMPIGPVAVYGASNFPLAFSVAGGDTSAAFASKNPVVCKGHPAHPGTSELVGRAIVQAVQTRGLPEGTFSLLQGVSPEMSVSLIRHPAIRAGAFTGSLRAGRALFDAACQRPEPIPFYAEMGSVNPVFVLPGALRERAEGIAQGLKNSVVLGVGQFCTNPGVVVGPAGGDMSAMTDRLRALIIQEPPASMLYSGILSGYQKGIAEREKISTVRSTKSEHAADTSRTEAPGVLFETNARGFLSNELLRQELFGPSTTVVHYATEEDLAAIAERLEGSLTATVHATAEDISAYRKLISVLETKVGRILFNGYPTGVEVCASMNHGGPYPATTDSKFTSVGTASIYRFVRPICYQSAPQEVLPPELQDGNPRGIWRTVDGVLGKV